MPRYAPPSKRTAAAATILAWLVVWPTIHMPLSTRLRFSPWKLGGFGMFSAPGDWMDGAIRVDVTVLDAAVPAPRREELGSFLEKLGGRVTGESGDPELPLIYVERSGLYGVVGTKLACSSTEDRTGFATQAENVMLWPRPTYVHALSLAAIRCLPGAAPDARVLVTRTTSRLDLDAREHYVEACTFVVTPIATELVGCVTSRRGSTRS